MIRDSFWITVVFDYRMYRYPVQLVEASPIRECFKIIGNNRSLILESNRPFFRNRGLNKRRINWKLVEGKINNYSFLEKIIEALEKEIKAMEMPPPNKKR